MLRHGARTFELVRQLDDENYHVEDCQTRRPSTLTKSQILKGIWDKKYQVVSAEGVEITSPKGRAVPVDLSSLDEEDTQIIDRKLAYINALQKAHVTLGQRERIKNLIPKVSLSISDSHPPKPSTVMSWARRYEKEGRHPIALKSGNSCRMSEVRLHPVVEEVLRAGIQNVYLKKSKPSQLHTLDIVRRDIAKKVALGELDQKDASVSRSTLSRRISEIDAYHRIAARDGRSRARLLSRTSMDGTQAKYPLQHVEIDHTILNWVVICDRTGLPMGRPVLTVAIDAFSGYVLGFYVSFYGAGLSSVSGVVRNMLQPKADLVQGIKLEHRWLSDGIPDELILDNGLEFHAAAFKRMAWELSSDITYCRVRTPWLKPHVERFFATLNFLTLSKGRVFKKDANIERLDPQKDAAISFSDLVKGLTMFVVDVHPFQVNQRKLARPYDLMLEGLELCPPVTYPGDMDALRLTSALSANLTLGQGGVELRGLPFGGPELLPLRKRLAGAAKVLVKWDPDDLSEIWIQDPFEKTWIQSPCRWQDYANGLSWNQHLLIRKFAREKLKASGAYEYLQAARLRLHDHWMEATSYRNRADATLAGRFSGVTSARVLAPQASTTPEPKSTPIPRLTANVEVDASQGCDVLEFDSFDMD